MDEPYKYIKEKDRQNLEKIVKQLEKDFQIYIIGSSLEREDYNDIDIVVRPHGCDIEEYQFLLPDAITMMLELKLGILVENDKSVNLTQREIETSGHGNYGGIPVGGRWKLDVDGTWIDLIFSAEAYKSKFGDLQRVLITEPEPEPKEELIPKEPKKKYGRSHLYYRRPKPETEKDRLMKQALHARKNKSYMKAIRLYEEAGEPTFVKSVINQARILGIEIKGYENYEKYKYVDSKEGD